jgi:hypothetical protein
MLRSEGSSIAGAAGRQKARGRGAVVVDSVGPVKLSVVPTGDAAHSRIAPATLVCGPRRGNALMRIA